MQRRRTRLPARFPTRRPLKCRLPPARQERKDRGEDQEARKVAELVKQVQVMERDEADFSK